MDGLVAADVRHLIFCIIVAVFWVRWLPGATMGRESSRESAIEILKRREKEEYERKRAGLRY